MRNYTAKAAETSSPLTTKHLAATEPRHLPGLKKVKHRTSEFLTVLKDAMESEIDIHIMQVILHCTA